MITQPSPRQRAARRQWRDPLARARLLAGQLLASEERRRARLVEDHLHLLDLAAGHWARRFPAVPMDDLRQAAYFGLRRAAERFDPERGVLFSTFAFHGLRNAIQCALPNLLGVVRVPRAASFPRPRMASLDDEDEGAPEPEDGSTASDPAHTASRAEDRERLRAALGQLRHERDARVVAMRYGLDGPPMTYREIGEVLGGICPELARQLELRGLAGLRDLLGE